MVTALVTGGTGSIDAEERITFFNTRGVLIDVNERDNTTGYDGVFAKIDMCRTHSRDIGLGDNTLHELVR